MIYNSPSVYMCLYPMNSYLKIYNFLLMFMYSHQGKSYLKYYFGINCSLGASSYCTLSGLLEV